MGKSRIDDAAMDRIKEQAAQFIADEMPKLADAMHATETDFAHKGKLTLQVEWSFKPGTENDPLEEIIRLHAKLDTPKLSTEGEKVVWNNGQMTLL